jgi:LysR family transcriptional activator of nhaA
MAFFASEELCKRRAGTPFPECLDGLPVLMPGQDTGLYGRLVRWFERVGVSPDLVAEFDDAALLTAFGRSGHGVFAAPAVLVEEIVSQYGMTHLGSTDEVHQEFYAISIQRRNTHPCVRAIFEHAAESLPERIARARRGANRDRSGARVR